jgi:hypothetical protein
MGTREYLKEIPEEISEGQVVVHNGIHPTRLGSPGFRAWLQERDDDNLEICDCGWASELGSHYRMRPLNLDIPKRAWDRP